MKQANRLTGESRDGKIFVGLKPDKGHQKSYSNKSELKAIKQEMEFLNSHLHITFAFALRT